jgi:hypothetical protein
MREWEKGREGAGKIRVRNIVRCCALICVIVVLAGCGKKSDKGTVTGSVTLDGQPIKTGLIRFMPVDGKTTTADSVITDGKFNASVPPGDKKVLISAQKVTGQRRVYETPDSPMTDVVQEQVPVRYNAQTTLTYSVTAGSQQKDFELTSGK